MDVTTAENAPLFEQPTATLVAHQQVMIEKWLLVLLIVGCTSLVFLICFPIDFFLYRRRKRLARERKNKLPIYQLRNTPRAEQNHAKINTHRMREMDIEEANETKRKTLDTFKAQVGLAKFFNKLKKKQQTDELSKELGESRSENSTEFQTLSTTPCAMERLNTVSKLSEIASSTDDSLKHLNVQEAEVRSAENDIVNSETAHNGHAPLNMKLVNVSTAWGENEELVDHETKHLNYGALEPFGNVLQSRPPQNQQNEQCFTIPLNKRYKILRTDHGESCTDFDVFDHDRTYDKLSSTDGRGRYKSFPPTKTGSADSHLDRLVHHPDPYRPNTRERIRSCESAMFEKTDVSYTSTDDMAFHPRHKVLEHSYSDQLISYCSNSETTRTNSRKAKKRNVVSPSPKPAPKALPEQFDDDGDNDTYSETNIIQDEFVVGQENASPVKVPKKKKKKKIFNKGNSSESLPDLSTDKEKF